MRAYKILSFSVVILLITVVFAGAVTVPAAAQYDTMQFRYNAPHTGDYSPVAGPVPSNGQLKWNYTTGGNVDSSPPSPTASSTWGARTATSTPSTPQHRREALELRDRRQRRLLPAVANGVVYVGSDMTATSTPSTPPPGRTVELHDRRQRRLLHRLSPAVANGVVYVGSWDNRTMLTTSTPSTPPPERSSGATRPEATVHSSPAVANGVVYVGSFDNNVYALNATTGANVWTYTTGGNVDILPAVANGVVYVGS